MATPIIHLRLCEAVTAEVKAVATKSNQTLSDVVREAIAEYLEKQQETPAA